MIYMKQAQTPAVSRHITDPAIRDYFQHEGHRTVISQRALQAHADPWLGWTELDGAGPAGRRGLAVRGGPGLVATSTTRRRSRRSSPTSAGPRPRCTRRRTTRAATRWCRSPRSGPSTRRSRPTRTASRELLVDFAHSYGARARADHQIFVDLFRNGRIPGL